jgi:hypothetical protein
MAISDDLPGIKVEVVVGGTAFTEYDHDDTGEVRTVTKYIEATSGRIFVVSIELLPSFKFKADCIAFDIEADGMMMDRPIILKTDKGRFRVVKGRRMSDTKVEKFQFSSLHTGERWHSAFQDRADFAPEINSSSTREDASRLKHLGSVVIKCTHKTVLRPGNALVLDKVHSPGSISEKALKGQAVSHNVT